MICYKDMTFCPFWLECANHVGCHRCFTKKEKDNAKRLGLPVALYISEPGCFVEYKANQKEMTP